MMAVLVLFFARLLGMIFMVDQHPPAPHSLAMGVCDLIWRDHGSGKRYILGCFSVLHSMQFPAIHPVLGVFVDLTGGRGKVPVKLQIIDVDEERSPVREAESEVDFSDDPRMIAELDFMLPGLAFPKPGEYRIQLFAYGEFIIERRLLVDKLEVSHDHK